MDYTKLFRVEPGARVRLDNVDASFKGKHASHEEAMPEIRKHVVHMDQLQYLLYADGSRPCSRPRFQEPSCHSAA